MENVTAAVDESKVLIRDAAFNLTEEQMDLRATREMQAFFIGVFEGTLVPIIGTIGLVGNLLCILVLKLKDLDLKPSFANLLVTLCVFDMIFIAVFRPPESQLHIALAAQVKMQPGFVQAVKAAVKQVIHSQMIRTGMRSVGAGDLNPALVMGYDRPVLIKVPQFKAG